MRWIEWIIQDPLAQMTFLAAVLTAALGVLIVRKALTRGARPATSTLIYTALAWVLFAAPCGYFWHQILVRQLPRGPLLHSTPSATFHTVDGKDVTLESLRGKVVVLDFWASWCAPCRQSSPAIAEMQSHYGPQLVTVGIGVDDAKDKFLHAMTGARPAIDVYDDGQHLRWLFHVGPIPHFVVIDRAGAVDTILTGWDPINTAKLQESVERNLQRP